MSNKTLKLVAVIAVVAIVFSAFNTYLLLDSIQVHEQLNAQNEQLIELQNTLTENEQQLTELQTALDTLNTHEEQISELQVGLNDTKDDLEAVTVTLSNMANQISALNQSTSVVLDEIETTLEGIVSDLSNLELMIDQMLSQTPEQVYADAYKSVVVITTPLGQGSGFLFENKNTIITNYHVVTTETDIEIEFFDGTRTQATLIGADAYSDVAVLEVSLAPDEAEPLTFSDESVDIGQQAVAIGNPLGFTDSLSVGYISQVNRLIYLDPLIVPVLQLDLTTAAGSSGGPLLDLSGNVIGITNAGTDVGFNFAVPVSILKRVVPSLLAEGNYTHPFVGIYIITLTPDVITALNIVNVDSYQTGLLVLGVMSGYPAEAAGLMPAISSTSHDGSFNYTAVDIILAVDGHPTLSLEDWTEYMELEVSAGQTVTLTVWRSGEISSVNLTTTGRPPY
ncbi:MAG: trypsin-like peptidase domain-containing protein [Candidatus Bathyarchaeota archaeon]|nr:trypsin-like peptidase domain-containing protein [Candidatus Bathyarchaeum sp.]